MKKQVLVVLAFVVLFLSILAQQGFAQEPLRFVTDPPQRIDVPFRLFKTENIWTQLLLDTRNGRIWQVYYTVEPNTLRVKIPINDTPLVADKGEVGRFTLYPTENMWTFLLLDQETGDVWQCQFSLDNNRFILPILSIDSLEKPKTAPTSKPQILLEKPKAAPTSKPQIFWEKPRE